MKSYLDLLQHIVDQGVRNPTEQELELSVFLDTNYVSTWQQDFPC